MADGGMAFAGDFEFPVSKARTSKVLLPKTRSPGVISGSPQKGLICGVFSPSPTSSLAIAERTEPGILVFRQPSTKILPFLSIMLEIAFAITTPGLVKRPPQFPEW